MAANDRLDILIIGGSGFVSGTMARVALSHGHEVSTLTRGQRPVPDGVHSLTADRHDEASFEQAVDSAGKHWDLVIDCIGFEAPDARQDLAVFRERAHHLVFISTDFVFDPAHRRFPQPEETEHYSDVGYGGQKRRCELEFIDGDAGDMQWTILRSCHIYGPDSLLGCLPTHGRDPQLLERMKAGEPLKLVGGGHSSRLSPPTWRRWSSVATATRRRTERSSVAPVPRSSNRGRSIRSSLTSSMSG